MTVITWKNVGENLRAPANAMYDMGADRIGTMFDGFQKALQTVQQSNQNEYNYLVDSNVNDFLSNVQGYNDVNKLQADQQAGVFQEMLKGYNGDIDMDKVRGAVDKRVNALQDRFTTDQTYKNAVEEARLQPLRDEAYKIYQTQGAEAAEAFAQKNGLGKKTYDMLQGAQTSDWNFDTAKIAYDKALRDEKTRPILERAQTMAINDPEGAIALLQRNNLGHFAGQVYSTRSSKLTADEKEFTALDQAEARDEKAMQKEVLKRGQLDYESARQYAVDNGASAAVLTALDKQQLEKFKIGQEFRNEANRPIVDKANALLADAYDSGNFEDVKAFIDTAPDDVRGKLQADYNNTIEKFRTYDRTRKTLKARDDANRLASEARKEYRRNQEDYVRQAQAAEGALAEFTKAPTINGQLRRDVLNQEQANFLNNVGRRVTATDSLNALKDRYNNIDNVELIANDGLLENAVQRFNSSIQEDIAPEDQAEYQKLLDNKALEFKHPVDKNVFNADNQNFDPLTEATSIVEKHQSKLHSEDGTFSDKERVQAIRTITRALAGNGKEISVEVDGKVEQVRLTPKLVDLAMSMSSGGWLEWSEDLPSAISDLMSDSDLKGQFKEHMEYEKFKKDATASFKAKYLRNDLGYLAKQYDSINAAASARGDDFYFNPENTLGDKEILAEVERLRGELNSARAGGSQGSAGEQKLSSLREGITKRQEYAKIPEVAQARKEYMQRTRQRYSPEEMQAWKKQKEAELKEKGISIDGLFNARDVLIF